MFARPGFFVLWPIGDTPVIASTVRDLWRTHSIEFDGVGFSKRLFGPCNGLEQNASILVYGGSERDSPNEFSVLAPITRWPWNEATNDGRAVSESRSCGSPCALVLSGLLSFFCPRGISRVGVARLAPLEPF